MPKYEEIIEQSQANVKALSNKLKELDELHQNIKEIVKQPEIFDNWYNEIVKLSESYTNTLGASTKKYLDGNNKIFSEKINELSSKIHDLEKEIGRLINTDFNDLFKNLQLVFIEKTRKDFEIELSKFDEKSRELKSKIEELNMLIIRLEDNRKLFEGIIESLSVQNITLKKEIKTNRVIQIIGFALIILAIAYLMFK